MNELSKIALGAFLSLANVLPAPALAAMPAAPADVLNVDVVCDPYGCYDTWRRPPPSWDDDYRRPPPPPPPIYRRPPPPPPLWDDGYRRPPPSWDDDYRRPPPPPPPIYRQPPPPPPIYGGRNLSRHVEWCFSRYRSYNPRTNSFLSTSGSFKICRSPYY